LADRALHLTQSGRARDGGTPRVPRIIPAVYIWPHSPAAQLNTWILGVIIAGVALVSFAVSMLRWVNALAAVWLFVSTTAVFMARPPDASRPGQRTH
jgi:hypothetical protein